MKSLTISSKNQVVIPTAVRAKLGVRSGDRLVVEKLSATELVLKKEPSYTDMVGTLPTQKTDPVERIRKLRNTWS
jgi:AbrB family looped-hinge helix DNA binding protein